MNNISRRKAFRPTDSQIITFAFIFLIVMGALLLSMPVSMKRTPDNVFLTALFTSTSALCVTGLSVIDVWNTYTFFGQAIILLLIQIGGLGFMALITGLHYMFKRKKEISSVSLLAESLGAEHLNGILQIHKHLLIGSFLFETAGTIALSMRFIPIFGMAKGLWFGLFHSISAFCNAGFDLMGIIEPGSSMILFQTDPVVCLTIAVLIISGGMGFFVWNDIITKHSYRRFSPYTKLVLWTTGVLLAFGTLMFLALEYNNPDTIGHMAFGDKLMNAFFQATTPRTAGFAALDQSGLTESSQMLTMILMLIGGSAGSTAGGIKTVTAVILFQCLITKLHGKRNVLLYHRKVSYDQIMHAASLLVSFLILGIFGGFYLDAFCPFGFSEAAFESFSALATVGLSLGVTSTLSLTSQLLMILFMFFGRVGVMTVSISFFRKKESIGVAYPSISIING